MRELLHDIRTYLRADFKPGLYAATAAWISLLIGINYAIGLENTIIDSQPFNPWRPVWYFGLYTTAYYGAFWLWSRFHHRHDIWQNRLFWQHTLVALVVYSYAVGSSVYADLARRVEDMRLYPYVHRILGNLHSILTILLPLVLYYYLIDKAQNGFYGLQPKRKGLLVYLTLLLLMVPVIALAATQPDFLLAYPTYRDTGAHLALNVPEWLTILGYELAYGWDFVPTELLFRGFLVIGLGRFINPKPVGSVADQTALTLPGPVLPMIIWYASIHFGRPLGETISSLFGGYILGVLALSTRSIWGGLFIHIGIAWLMEAAAFLASR
ncbi:CPBP family intramembrane glutamic endopeptidase [Fibrella sp. WM1]|uniref:CPBP family intramembrane glutamic endopeptidase n=1 Tax=Fibrella musci TaxID=3242485 RepID=UPI0035201901